MATLAEPSAAGLEPIPAEFTAPMSSGRAERAPARPWYVVLRPWLFCLLFLVCGEIATRGVYDHSLCLRQERFDNFPGPAAEDVWMDQIRRDPAYRVVLVGDSVTVGGSLLPGDQTIARHLQRILEASMPGRRIHVWNLGVAGARAPDHLSLILKLLDAKPDLVVVSANYIGFGSYFLRLPLAHPWLAWNLASCPPSLESLLPRRSWKAATEDRVTRFFEGNLRLVGMRQDINARLFGVQPRNPYETPNPVIMAAASIGTAMGRVRMTPWRQRGQTLEQFRILYDPVIRPDNMMGKYYAEILSALRRGHTPSLTYVTPQNPEIVPMFVSPAAYRKSREVITGFLRDPVIPSYDLSDLLGPDRFYDNDHLMPEGNCTVAQALAAKIVPIITRSAPGSGRT